MSDFTRYILVDNGKDFIAIENRYGAPVVVVRRTDPENFQHDYVYDMNPVIWEALESYSILLEAYRESTKSITDLEQKVGELQESVSAATAILDSINKAQYKNITSSLFDENSWVQSEQ